MRQATVLEIRDPGNDRHWKPVPEPLGDFKHNIDALRSDKVREGTISAASKCDKPSPAEPGAHDPVINNSGCGQHMIEGRANA
ncbi:hypothetical protein [Mesorhizobium sp.]|uniref:hypothetical protein n=1 Tax=Mesorhizobium sp. TaxID=1871066 RepID=UPI0025E87A50|nr:hypothetical protein [Mesorhizobium sp.]